MSVANDDMISPCFAKNGFMRNKQDRFTNIPADDIHFHILSYLDTPSLLALNECSIFFNKISSNCSVWSVQCKDLWKDKVHMSEKAVDKFKCSRALKNFCNKKMSIPQKVESWGSCQCSKNAYRNSLLDFKFHQTVTAKELCNFTWSFRFKESAGIEWMQTDPWWSGKKARKFSFLTNGQILRCHAEQGEKKRKATNLETKNGTNHDSFSPHNASMENFAERSLNPFDAKDIRWKFIRAPLDIKNQLDDGGCVRITINGREIPTYVVRRTPNWGFILENCWGVYTSFDMPLKGECSTYEDKHLYVDNSSQWREALLCNLGVNRLPEGEKNKEIFDLIWEKLFEKNKIY